jgi:hypothetical protein
LNGLLSQAVFGTCIRVYIWRYGDDLSRVFDRRLPPEPPYPSMIPSLADFTAVMPTPHLKVEDQTLDARGEGNEKAFVFHAPPG